MARRVHIATPTTLITMLRTAQYAWQQAALGENARAMFEVGKELYERLCTMGRNVDALGRSLSRTVGVVQQDRRFAGDPRAGHRAQAARPGRGRRAT